MKPFWWLATWICCIKRPKLQTTLMTAHQYWKQSLSSYQWQLKYRYSPLKIRLWLLGITSSYGVVHWKEKLLAYIPRQRKAFWFALLCLLSKRTGALIPRLFAEQNPSAFSGMAMQTKKSESMAFDSLDLPAFPPYFEMDLIHKSAGLLEPFCWFHS